MKDRKVIIGVIVVVALLVGAYFLFWNGFDYGNNGIWVADEINPDTGEMGSCNSRPGQTGFVECCLNYEMQQVDCRDANKLLGVSPLAIYRGTPGVGYVQHILVIKNTGNVNLTAQLESFSWTANPTTASVTFLNNAWQPLVKNPKSIPKGEQKDWKSFLINVQEGCPPTLTRYNVTAVAKATAIVYDPEGNPYEYSQTSTKGGYFDCQRESISFDFDITF